MIRVLLFMVLFLPISLSACALCSLYSPSAMVSIALDINQSTLKGAEITWRFTPEFTRTLLESYDTNHDQTINPAEIPEIDKALIDYLKPLDYLTTVKYGAKKSDLAFEEVPKLPIPVMYHKTYLKKQELYFTYRFGLDLPLKSGHILFMQVHDNGGYFKFRISSDITYTTPESLTITNNPNMYMVFFDIIDKSKSTAPAKVAPQTTATPPAAADSAPETDSPYIVWLSGILTTLSDRLKSHLQSIKESQSSLAFLSLILFSFAYGLIHAAGPGHGKTIVSGYFFATNRNIKKALGISLLIGVVHTFSALVLTLVVYFVLKTLLGTVIGDVTLYMTKVSGLIIILVALYLLYLKMPKKQRGSLWQTHAPTCACHSCQTGVAKSSDLGVILSAGMIPCPGTVLVFIFTISLEMYFAGFVSALFMSLGMSTIIFLAAAASIAVRNSVDQRYQRLSQWMSIAALAIILLLGAGMLLV